MNTHSDIFFWVKRMFLQEFNVDVLKFSAEKLLHESREYLGGYLYKYKKGFGSDGDPPGLKEYFENQDGFPGWAGFGEKYKPVSWTLDDDDFMKIKIVPEEET